MLFSRLEIVLGGDGVGGGGVGLVSPGSPPGLDTNKKRPADQVSRSGRNLEGLFNGLPETFKRPWLGVAR